MRDEVFVSYSGDKIVDEQDADNYPSEYLNTINMSSLPPHLLKLKVGAVVILLRNLSPSTGLCNGTRLRVTRINQRIIECESLPVNMQAIWFLYPAFLWHPPPLPTYLLTFNELSSLSDWHSL